MHSAYIISGQGYKCNDKEAVDVKVQYVCSIREVFFFDIQRLILNIMKRYNIILNSYILVRF